MEVMATASASFCFWRSCSALSCASALAVAAAPPCSDRASNAATLARRASNHAVRSGTSGGSSSMFLLRPMLWELFAGLLRLMLSGVPEA